MFLPGGLGAIRDCGRAGSDQVVVRVHRQSDTCFGSTRTFAPNGRDVASRADSGGDGALLRTRWADVGARGANQGKVVLGRDRAPGSSCSIKLTRSPIRRTLDFDAVRAVRAEAQIDVSRSEQTT